MPILDRLRLGRRTPIGDRSLGLLQRWYLAQVRPRVAAVVLETKRPSSARALEDAVRTLAARDPSALGVCEERTTTSLRLRPLRSGDALPWFETNHDDPWRTLEDMLHLPFAAGAPLYRLALDATGSRVVFAFDHAVTDGVGAAFFAANVARCLAGEAPADGRASELPLDGRLDLRPSVVDLARALRDERRRFSLGIDPPASDAPLRTRLLPLALDPSNVADLQREARARSSTVHAILSGAALLAARDVFGVAHLRLATPVSLRDRCVPPAVGMGVFVASVQNDVTLRGDEDPWDVAAECRRQLVRHLPRSHRQIGLLAFAGDLGRFARKVEERGRTSTVEVSNIGRVDDLPAGNALWLAQGVHYHGPLLALTVATSGDGSLRTVLSYPEPLVSAGRARAFADRFDATLRAARLTSRT